jgi:arginine exporter protein ArgO
MTLAVTLTSIGALTVLGIHAFLFWWRQGPGRNPRYQRGPGELSAIPGPFRVWQLAFAISLWSPPVVFVVGLAAAQTSAANAAMWAVAVVVASQLLLFVAAFGAWSLRRHTKAARPDAAAR